MAATSSTVGAAALTGSAGSLEGGSFFSLAPMARGDAVEAALAGIFGGGLPRTFPTIDRFLNGVATSAKSIDLGSRTYQTVSNLTNRLNLFADKLVHFSGGRRGQTSVNQADVTERVLELVIRSGAVTPQQIEAINRFIQRANRLGIKVKIFVAE